VRAVDGIELSCLTCDFSQLARPLFAKAVGLHTFSLSRFVARSLAANACDQLGVLLDFNNHIHENLSQMLCIWRHRKTRREEKKVIRSSFNGVLLDSNVVRSF
jgi:hypothetical protein